MYWYSSLNREFHDTLLLHSIQNVRLVVFILRMDFETLIKGARKLEIDIVSEVLLFLAPPKFTGWRELYLLYGLYLLEIGKVRLVEYISFRRFYLVGRMLPPWEKV